MNKKLKFEAEVQDNGKILIRCDENKDMNLVLSPNAIGNFVRKNLGLVEDEK